MGNNSTSSTTQQWIDSTKNQELSSLARIRIKNELNDINDSPPARWRVNVINERTWSIWVTAEDQSPFHTVAFEIKVHFHPEYPTKRPCFELVNHRKFFHPNINRQTGKVCQASAFNGRTPSTMIRDMVDAFVTLLSHPNPHSSLNGQAANLLLGKNPLQYNVTAQLIFRGYRN